MVKLYLVLILLFFSCTKRKESIYVNGDSSAICLKWELNNPELQEQIIEFYNTAAPVGLNDKLLVVYYYEENGFEYYCLYQILGAYSLRNSSIRLLVKVNEILVGVAFESADAFPLSEQSLVEIMKEVFPRDYEYYQRQLELNKKDPFAATYSTQETLFPPPVTGDSDYWKLKFKDGKMIEKKVKKRW